MSLTTPAPIRGSYRFGDTPFTQEAADRMARRIHVLVEADPEMRNLDYWSRRIGLAEDELAQVRERYEEMDRWGWVR